MSDVGVEQRVTAILSATTDRTGYPLALVCTDAGLLVASSGDPISSEELAAVTSLFDDIVMRAERDLHMHRVDEVGVHDPGRGRLVVRPIPIRGIRRFFLVVRVQARAPWRRETNTLCRTLAGLLRPFAVQEDG